MSGEKFNRAFLLKYEIPAKIAGTYETISMESPLTCEFQVTRANLARENTANFTIYNLNSSTRSKVVKDIWDVTTRFPVQFFAGYQPNINDILPMLFNGTSRRAYSYRQGSDFRTVIDCFDGLSSFSTPNISVPIAKGTSQTETIKKVAKALDGVKTVTVGNKFETYAKRAMAIIGNPMDILQELTKNNFYIDSGNAYALDTSEVIPGDIKIINADNGLIGTPRKSDTLVEVEMLFEPRIKPSQLIELESITEWQFNGTYKVTGVQHRGVISDAVSGDLRTKITMQKITNPTIIYDFSYNRFNPRGLA